MQTDGLPERVEDAYTHIKHAKRCVEHGRRGVVLRQFVQAKLGRTLFCGRIESAWDTDDGREMWRLDLVKPLPGIASVPAYQVRQCSGIDGFCACAGETAGASERAPRAADPADFAVHSGCGLSQAGVVAPPESLTHETSSVSAGA
jgi:hypothetical protein